MTATEKQSMTEHTPYQRWRMCGCKKFFETERKANRFADKRDMDVYECPVCHYWHITKRAIAKART